MKIAGLNEEKKNEEVEEQRGGNERISDEEGRNEEEWRSRRISGELRKVGDCAPQALATANTSSSLLPLTPPMLLLPLILLLIATSSNTV